MATDLIACDSLSAWMANLPIATRVQNETLFHSMKRMPSHCLCLTIFLAGITFAWPDSYENPLDALQDPDVSVRMAVIEVLINKTDQRALEPLIGSLTDSDARVRNLSILALVQLHDTRAVVPLLDSLKDLDPKVRASAAGALGSFNDVRAVEPLMDTLKDKDAKVGALAAESLGKLKDSRAVEPLITCIRENPLLRESAAGAIGNLGRAAFQPLIACLQDTNWEVRNSAAMALGGLGDTRALAPLLICLKDQDLRVRASAAQTLGLLGDKRATEALFACLSEKGGLVRASAAEALGKLGDVRSEIPLIACLQDPDWEARNVAVKALGEIPDARSVEPLIQSLKDNDVRVQASTAASLGNLSDGRAVPPLIECLKSSDAQVRTNTAESLGKLGDLRAVNPLAEAMPDWAAKDQIGPALRKLKWTPTTDSEKIYYWACVNDGADLHTQWQKTKRVLFADLQSNDCKKIENAAYTLVALRNAEVIPNLIDCLKHRGSPEMAFVCLNCGESRLAAAARSSIYAGQTAANQASLNVRWGQW